MQSLQNLSLLTACTVEVPEPFLACTSKQFDLSKPLTRLNINLNNAHYDDCLYICAAVLAQSNRHPVCASGSKSGCLRWGGGGGGGWYLQDLSGHVKWQI